MQGKEFRSRDRKEHVVMKRVFPKEEACMACRLCEIACVVEHSKSKDIVKAYKKETPIPMSRTFVEEREAVSFSIQCRHCENPPCVEACMNASMQKKEDGVVLVDENKCIGCWMCIMVCPFGVIKKNLNRKISSKCDLCPDRATPACVEACPNDALFYEER